VSPDLTQAIRKLLGVAHGLKLDAVLIGAVVSELAAVEDEGLTPPRGTNDADFALRIKDWAEFAKLKKGLVEAGFTGDPKIEHRLHMGLAMVDVVPYGPEISSKEGEIFWPVAERSMVVLGFEEACAHAVESQVEPNLCVKRLTLPGFVLLKIMAFLDRRAAGVLKYRNDAEDLLFWFQHYASGKHEERRYEILTRGLSEIQYDSAGAALLGLEVAALASPAAAARVRHFLDLAVDLYGPFVAAATTSPFEGRRKRVLQLATAFKRGFEAGQIRLPHA
jgi:predicted nucleotidyltransferase